MSCSITATDVSTDLRLAPSPEKPSRAPTPTPAMPSLPPLMAHQSPIPYSASPVAPPYASPRPTSFASYSPQVRLSYARKLPPFFGGISPFKTMLADQEAMWMEESMPMPTFTPSVPEPPPAQSVSLPPEQDQLPPPLQAAEESQPTEESLTSALIPFAAPAVGRVDIPRREF